MIIYSDETQKVEFPLIKVVFRKKLTSRILLLNISHRDGMINVQYETTFSAERKFWRPWIKNPIPQFCQAWSGEQMQYLQHGHISWIESYKKSRVKKCRFGIIMWLSKTESMTFLTHISKRIFQTSMLCNLVYFVYFVGGITSDSC